jgi:hypothetical protein
VARYRRWALALVAGLVAPFLVPEPAQPAVAGPSVTGSAAAPAASAPRCGAKDRPETGTHGDVPLVDQITGRADEGYSCGLALVGYNPLGARGGNANMAWSGDCAYIAGDGVAVVDVSDPAHPKHVRTLHGAGSDATIETLAAVDAPGRHLLATGRYGLFGLQGSPGTAPVDLWDVQDCAHPKKLTTLRFPSNVHNLTFTADGRRLWSTLPVQAMDLSDLRRPKVLPNIERDLAASGHPNYYYGHEVWPPPDNTRLYVGGQIGFLPEETLIVDTSRWPEHPAKVIGSLPEPGHSIRPATIGGKPYLLQSDETVVSPLAKGCLPDYLTPFGGASRPKLTDISNEQLPRRRSTLEVEINEPKHCAEQVLSGVNASSHYHDVDDPDDTTFAMVSAWNAGLRLFDVRDPLHPREVAYFNPGRFAGSPLSSGGPPGVGTVMGLLSTNGLDQAWAHIRYRADTGHIWLTTATGGFWVLELEPQLRAALDLPAMPARHPEGTAPRPPASRIAIASTTTGAAVASYCALSTARTL